MDVTCILGDFIYDVIQEYPDEVLHTKQSYIQMCEIVSKDIPILFNILSLEIIDPTVVCEFIEVSHSQNIYNPPYYQSPYIIFNNLNDLLYFMKDFLEHIEHPESVNLSRSLSIMEEWVVMNDLCMDLYSIKVSGKTLHPDDLTQGMSKLDMC